MFSIRELSTFPLEKSPIVETLDMTFRDLYDDLCHVILGGRTQGGGGVKRPG